MKKRLLLLFLIVSLVLSVTARAVIVGNAAGYLLDRHDPYFTARIGGEIVSALSAQHIAELEFGYSTSSASGVKTTLLPVMVNYRAQIGGFGLLGFYAGLGGGAVRTEARIFGAKAEAWTGVAQAFGGVSITVFKNAAVDLGARYLRIRDFKAFDEWSGGGGDTVVEAGFHYQF